jgi:hypothetical protein
MISSRSVQNVLRIVRAGKEEAPPGSAVPDAPAATAPTPGAPPPAAPAAAPEAPEEPGSIVARARYYFFDAPAGNKIPFKDIDGILKSNNNVAKAALVENLKGGNSGKFCADYFRWLKIVIAADLENGTRFVYSCDLNPVRFLEFFNLLVKLVDCFSLEELILSNASILESPIIFL